MDKKSGISCWWAGLKENYVRLWSINSQYLLGMLPAAICGFLFVRFHAYLFMLLALALMVPAGPAMLAAQNLSAPYGFKNGRSCVKAFWRTYRKLFRRGSAIGLCFGVVTVVVFLPAYYALTSGNMVGAVCGCCACAAFLFLSGTTQAQYQLMEKGNVSFYPLVADVFSNAKQSAMIGAIKLVWCLLVLYATYFSVGCALLGAPMIIRFTARYLIYGKNDGTVD